jgi:phosphate-induced protein 1
MNTKRLRTAFAVLLSLLILPTLTSAQTPSNPVGAAAGFKRVGIMSVINRSTSATAKYNGITYNGGPIIDDANGVNVYYIWYGDWSKDKDAQTILTDFIKHFGDSPYVNINTTYYDYEVGPNGTNVVKDRVVTGVHYMGSTNDYYSQGVNLTDDGLGLVIQNAVADGRLPLDHNGVYFVLTSADVTETSGFCTVYCAFHGFQPAGALGNLIGAFVGNGEAQCPSVCSAEVLQTPNNNVGADGMVNGIAHELEESVTDPLGTGWVNSDGSENEDICSGTYGKTYALPNGSYANMKLGKRQYLIQQNWVNAKGGYCALRWDE